MPAKPRALTVLALDSPDKLARVAHLSGALGVKSWFVTTPVLAHNWRLGERLGRCRNAKWLIMEQYADSAGDLAQTT
jgi:hypothetical protein